VNDVARRVALLVAVLLVVPLLVGAWLRPLAPGAGATVTSAATTAANGGQALAPPRATAATPATPEPPPAPPPAALLLRLPDGSTTAALNDVDAVAPIAWGDRPWSPIVTRERHDGVEWYRHADGSFTTTRMVWRSDLGRDDPATICVHPVRPGPTRAPSPDPAK
jgi:hypothetical protein